MLDQLFSPDVTSPVYTLVVLPLFIFAARVFDVSLQTLRVIFVSRDMKYAAPIVGFFEVLIWLLAMGQIMQNLDNLICYFAYAGGFAMGTLVGISIERRLSLGMLLVKVMTKRSADLLVNRLRAAHFGVTEVDGEGCTGKVNVLFMVIRRSDLPKVVGMIKEFNPKAFYSVSDLRTVGEGIFPLRDTVYRTSFRARLSAVRVGK